MSRAFTPTPTYKLFLARLVHTRLDREMTVEQLAERLGLTPAQVAAFEAGAQPLGFIDVRNWLRALDMPFVQFTQQMEEVFVAEGEDDPTHEFSSTHMVEDATDKPDKYARAAPLASQVPAIQVLFFAPGEAPHVRTIENTLEAKQALVGGLIATFETGVSGTIGIANDEALLEDMPFNREIPETSAHIYGPFFVDGDVDGGFRTLAPLELERTLDALCLELSYEDMQAILKTLDGGAEWIEMWG